MEKSFFEKKRFLLILTFLVVFWVFCVFLIIFHTLKRNYEMPLSISIRITQRNDEISPFGWIITFWVQKLICILSFLLFFKITAYLIIFFWWFDNILKGSYYDFLLKCEKWLKIQKKTKKQPKMQKLGKKTIFTKNDFSMKEARTHLFYC